MKYNDIIKMLEETGLPFAYDHFAEGESPGPPFVVFLLSSSDNFSADNIVYKKIDNLNIELYTDKKDPRTEEKIESVLSENELPFNKTETWIDSEKLYEVLFETEIIGG